MALSSCDTPYNVYDHPNASRYSVAVNILNKELWVANNGPPAWRAANIPYHKNIKFYEMEDRQTEAWTTSVAEQKL